MTVLLTCLNIKVVLLKSGLENEVRMNLIANSCHLPPNNLQFAKSAYILDHAEVTCLFVFRP